MEDRKFKKQVKRTFLGILNDVRKFGKEGQSVLEQSLKNVKEYKVNNKWFEGVIWESKFLDLNRERIENEYENI